MFYGSRRSVNCSTDSSVSEESKQLGHGCLSVVVEPGADTGLFTRSKSPLSSPICQPVQTPGRSGLVQDLMTG